MHDVLAYVLAAASFSGAIEDLVFERKIDNGRQSRAHADPLHAGRATPLKNARQKDTVRPTLHGKGKEGTHQPSPGKQASKQRTKQQEIIQ